jgi:hypothetical protein
MLGFQAGFETQKTTTFPATHLRVFNEKFATSANCHAPLDLVWRRHDFIAAHGGPRHAKSRAYGLAETITVPPEPHPIDFPNPAPGGIVSAANCIPQVH